MGFLLFGCINHDIFKIKKILKLELVQHLEKTDLLHDVMGYTRSKAFMDGFDAASAEYEKIIAELEGALESIVEIDLLTHKMHPEYEGQFSEYADIAKKSLQKLEEFK